MVSDSEQLLDFMIDGVLVLNGEGVVLYANSSARQLFALFRRDLVGQMFGLPVEGEQQTEIEVASSGGTRRILEMRFKPIEWHREFAYLVSLRDVTEQQKIQESLRYANALNQSILDSLHTNIAVLNMQGKIIMTNRSWVQFAQENGDDEGNSTGVGTNYFDICRQSTDIFGKTALIGMLAVASGERATFELEYPCHAPHEKRWFVMRVKPLLERNQINGLVVSHINITQYRKDLLTQSTLRAENEIEHNQTFELLALELLDYVSKRPNLEAEVTPTTLQIVALNYEALLEKYVQNRTHKVYSHIQQETEKLADEMGYYRIHPRDLVKIHVETLRIKQESTPSVARMQVYMDEGRMLLLELMGYLTAYYRRYMTMQLHENGAKPEE